MPKTYVTFIDGSNIYCCKKCESHMVGLNELVSKAFRGRTGTAYLFNNVQVETALFRMSKRVNNETKIC